MKELFEEAWAGRPADPEPWELARRRRLLLGAVTPGMRVLDLGCGAGRFTRLLGAAGAIAVGVDVAEGALGRARANDPGGDYRLAPVDGPLPLDHGEADLVWASEVIEHVADPVLWVGEVRRVLRPGGRLLLTTPYHGRVQAAVVALVAFERHFDPTGDHLRFFTRRSLRDVLERAAFRVEVRAVGGVPLARRMLVADAERLPVVPSA